MRKASGRFEADWDPTTNAAVRIDSWDCIVCVACKCLGRCNVSCVIKSPCSQRWDRDSTSRLKLKYLTPALENSVQPVEEMSTKPGQLTDGVEAQDLSRIVQFGTRRGPAGGTVTESLLFLVKTVTLLLEGLRHGWLNGVDYSVSWHFWVAWLGQSKLECNMLWKSIFPSFRGLHCRFFTKVHIPLKSPSISGANTSWQLCAGAGNSAFRVRL